MKNGEEPINATYFKDNEINAIGLTKREYFAGLAMQALITAHLSVSYESITNDSVVVADLLLKALEE